MKFITTFIAAASLITVYNFVHAQQGHWHLKASFADSELNDVRFPDTLTGYVFGEGVTGPLVMKTTDGGETWSDVSPVAPDSRFASAWFLNAQTGYVVGRYDSNDGVIAQTSDGGNTWNVNTTTANERLNGVAFNDSLTGFICGRDGYGLRTQDGGITWQPFSFGTNEDLEALYFFAPDNGLVVGDAGFMALTQDGGNTWVTATTPSSDDFTSIHFTDSLNGLVAGEPGVLMSTNDGGVTWNLLSSGVNDPLLDVTAASINSAWAGGENGVLLTTADGITWSNDTALTTLVITGLHSIGNNAWLITEDGNVFKWTNKFSNDTTTIDTTSTDTTTTFINFLSQSKPKCYFTDNGLVVEHISSEATTLDLYDVMGRAVISGVTIMENGTANIAMTNADAGVYFVVIRNGLYEAIDVLKVLR